MNSSVTKILSLFLLAVFAFPFIQKEIHSLEHSDEVHCTTKTEKHFHEQEHSCSVCDFTMPASESVKEPAGTVANDSTLFTYSGLTQQLVYFFVEQFFLQRAPPAQAN